MAYVIGDECISCGACEGECPVGAISEGDGKYVIDADTCASCGACAVFRACALRVLATSALRAFTFLQAFALLKMPEMTYTPSFLI